MCGQIIRAMLTGQIRRSSCARHHRATFRVSCSVVRKLAKPGDEANLIWIPSAFDSWRSIRRWCSCCAARAIHARLEDVWQQFLSGFWTGRAWWLVGCRSKPKGTFIHWHRKKTSVGNRPRNPPLSPSPSLILPRLPQPVIAVQKNSKSLQQPRISPSFLFQLLSI